jgi:hypothetical protein
VNNADPDYGLDLFKRMIGGEAAKTVGRIGFSKTEFVSLDGTKLDRLFSNS